MPSGHVIPPEEYVKTLYSRSLYIPEDILSVGESYTIQVRLTRHCHWTGTQPTLH
jgi:hypothetical protein